MAQIWLAWQAVVTEWVDDIGFEGEELDRARFVAMLATDAVAPTNFLLGNPSALKKAFETRGSSLVAGIRNLVDDLRYNHGMPSQVGKSAFKVGGNIANAPGAVIYRDEIAELIQYQPATDTLNARPLFVVPPQINKYYLYDMSPDKSIVKYLTEQGLQVFMVSWRNPTTEHRNWGLDAHHILGTGHRRDETGFRSGCDQCGWRLRGWHHARGSTRLPCRLRRPRQGGFAHLDGQRVAAGYRGFSNWSVCERANHRSSAQSICQGRCARR